MNKNIAIVITAVLLLGMGLITYNEYTNPTTTPFSSQANTLEALDRLQSTTKPEVPAETNTTALQKDLPPLAPSEKPFTAPKVKPEIVSTAPSSPTAPAPITQPPVTSKPELSPPAAASYRAPVAPKPTTPPAPVEDPVKKALEASRKESTLPKTLLEPEKPAEKPKTPAKSTASTAKTIKKITVSTVGDGVTVRLDSTEMPKYKVIRLKSPERLVLDLIGKWKLRAPGVPKNDFVSNVRIGDHKEGTRIVIDLKKAPTDIRYLKYGETGLDVRLR